MTSYWATSLFAGRPASGTECFEVRLASEVEAALAEKDAEISRLKVDVTRAENSEKDAWSQLAAARAEIESLKGLPPSVEEALNMGDGSYKP